MHLSDLLKSSNVTVYDLDGKVLRIESKFLSPGGERELARLVAPIFDEPPRWHVRPAWLTNPVTGKRLELDLLFSSAAVAFEFNGLVHRLPEQGAKDAVKAWLCWLHGIALVVVKPYELSRGLGAYWETLEEYFRRRVKAAKRRCTRRKYGEGLKKDFVKALGVLTGDIREDLLPLGTL